MDDICDVCGPGGCGDTCQQGVLKHCDVCGPGGWVMFVVQVDV